MLIEIKDLREGDEILVPSLSKLKYLRVLRDPQLRTNPNYRGNYLYKAVKCSAKCEMTEHTSTWGGTTHKWTSKEFICTPENHNHTFYRDLNHSDIWLVNRKEK